MIIIKKNRVYYTEEHTENNSYQDDNKAFLKFGLISLVIWVIVLILIITLNNTVIVGWLAIFELLISACTAIGLSLFLVNSAFEKL